VGQYSLIARQLRFGTTQGAEDPLRCFIEGAGWASDTATEAEHQAAERLLWYERRRCPECEAAALLWLLLKHLHRDHHWPVELIAHWVAGLP
jgi:hypothetical protein